MPKNPKKAKKWFPNYIIYFNCPFYRTFDIAIAFRYILDILKHAGKNEMKIAIDIGTTNIEAALCDNNSILERIQSANLLSQFGLDVMTRINKALDGNADVMCHVLRNQLKDIISSLLSTICTERIPVFASNDLISVSLDIACNTPMTYILMNYDCSNLAAFPFSPVCTDIIHTDTDSLGLCFERNFPVSICPGLSAFIGGDIVSGLSSLSLEKDKNILFVDMGTNAEMVYITEDTAYITSAAAGPAFETCGPGMASEIVSLLSDMLDNKIIDETGLLQNDFFETGYDCHGIHISQKKIRDIQMAKSAIRSGIDIILNNTEPDIMVISGSFGDNLNYDAAVKIGLIPDIGKTKIVFTGNTSLKGAVNGFGFSKLPNIIEDKNIEEIFLANHNDFGNSFIANMNF